MVWGFVKSLAKVECGYWFRSLIDINMTLTSEIKKIENNTFSQIFETCTFSRCKLICGNGPELNTPNSKVQYNLYYIRVTGKRLQKVKRLLKIWNAHRNQRVQNSLGKYSKFYFKTFHWSIDILCNVDKAQYEKIFAWPW